jgi:hypothetical protein
MLGKRGGTRPRIAPRARVTTWEIPELSRGANADLEAFRRARDAINNMVGGLFLDHWRNLA